MINSSKVDVIAGSAAAAASQLGYMLAPSSNLSLAAMQGQKWHLVFDLDKVIKQLRSAEKTQLRGGGPRRNAPAAGVWGGASGTKQAVQVQRLKAADMAYYEMVPKQATRDIVLCNSCNGTYSKPGFNNHIALQHPSIWDAVPNKVNHSSTGTTLSASSGVAADAYCQDGVRDPAELLGLPTDTSATASSCSNGSNSSVVAFAPNNNSNNNAHVSSSSTSLSSTSSSRHKNSSKSSRSSCKTTTGSRSSTSRSRSSKNRQLSEMHQKVAAATVAAAAPPVVKDEPPALVTPSALTVFSSSLNSSCPMSLTLTLSASVAGCDTYSPSAASPYLSSLLGEPHPNKKLKVSTSSVHRSKKPANQEKQLAPHYVEQQQQLCELDQAVSCIIGHGSVEAQHQQQRHQHQVDLFGVTEQPLQNTFDDNSISLTLDDMLDSKFINDILNNVEPDIPFDVSALDISQSQSQFQQQLPTEQQQQHAQPAKRLRYEDYAGDYATALYQQQQQQQYGEGQQPGAEQTQLTALDAMQLHQQQQELDLAAAQQASIFYKIPPINQVSVLDQQGQQQVIAEFPTQAIYDNVHMNLLQAAAAPENLGVGVGVAANHFNDELNGYEFTKLETVSAEPNRTTSTTTKTVKLEMNQLQQQQPLQKQQQGSNPAQPHRKLLNAKYLDDSSYFNTTLYAGPPRPLAINTFGLVNLPNGMGATLRKNLLMTRKVNNSLHSLNGSSGFVGTLARTPPPLPATLNTSLNCNGSTPGQQFQPPHAFAAQGKTIYAQKSSVIAQECLRCNKRALVSRLTDGLSINRLNELFSCKLSKTEREREQQNEANEQLKQEQQQKVMHSFYEKRRKLLTMRHQQRHRAMPIGSSNTYNSSHFQHQRPLHLQPYLQRGGGGGVVSTHAMSSTSSHQQLLKKQLLRTFSDSSNILTIGVSGRLGSTGAVGGGTGGSGSGNPWKSNSSTQGSNSTGSDLMRVFV